MGKAKAKPKQPWDLPPETIAEKVVEFRMLMDMSAQTLYESVGMDHRTLAKIEAGTPVDRRIIGRLARRFPGVFA